MSDYDTCQAPGILGGSRLGSSAQARRAAQNQILAAPKPTETQQANIEVGSLRETILETRSMLTELSDRLLGPVPEANASNTDAMPHFGGGVLGELRSNIDAARDNAAEVRSLARRLSQNV